MVGVWPRDSIAGGEDDSRDLKVAESGTNEALGDCGLVDLCALHQGTLPSVATFPMAHILHCALVERHSHEVNPTTAVLAR